jgi:putative transposase
MSQFDLPDAPKPAIEPETAIGIDVGFDRFATNSDGGVTENPRFFRKADRKIRRAGAATFSPEEGEREPGQSPSRIGS